MTPPDVNAELFSTRVRETATAVAAFVPGVDATATSAVGVPTTAFAIGSDGVGLLGLARTSSGVGGGVCGAEVLAAQPPSKTASRAATTPRPPAFDRPATWQSRAFARQARRSPRAAAAAGQARARHARACPESWTRAPLPIWRSRQAGIAPLRQYPARGTSLDGTTARPDLQQTRQPVRTGWPGIPQATRRSPRIPQCIILMAPDPGQARRGVSINGCVTAQSDYGG